MVSITALRLKSVACIFSRMEVSTRTRFSDESLILNLLWGPVCRFPGTECLRRLSIPPTESLEPGTFAKLPGGGACQSFRVDRRRLGQQPETLGKYARRWADYSP